MEVSAGGRRLPALAGIGIGLGASPFVASGGAFVRAAALLLLVLIVLGGRKALTPVAALLILLAGVGVGLGGGAERLEAIDGQALTARAGQTATITGYAAAAPRVSRGLLRFPLDSPEGRVLVEAVDDRSSVGAGADSRDAGLGNAGLGNVGLGNVGLGSIGLGNVGLGNADLGGIGPGTGVTVHGVLRWSPEWYRSNMRRQGIAMVLHADQLSKTGERRGGPAGLVDGMRIRAEAALEKGMPDRESALARGFVLGQDGSIDPGTVDQFRDSGLAHLLAVSGQNVVLLALLAVPFMAAAGLRPGTRLALVAALILVYIPLAGSGPSIQRAGVMGLAGLAATAATRSASRIYAIALAAVVTLGLNPRAITDPGWQLSFAAVLGILILAGPFRVRLAGLTGEGWRRALCDGLAITLAASLATAPLMAAHFDRLALGTVVANLVALPAVAPAMWLGMISAAVGQLSAPAAVPFNLVNSVLLAYIAQVAAWFSRPGWVVAGFEPGGPVVALIGYLGLAMVLAAVFRFWRPSGTEGGEPTPPPSPSERRRRRTTVMVLGALLLAGLIWLGPGLFGDHRRELGPTPPGGARIEVLDIGQGDATLLRPDGGDPVLIDGGPPGGDLRGALESAGVGHLSAVILTHPDLDHWGGLADLFGPVEVDRFLFDVVPGRLLAQSRRAGSATARLSAGDRVAFGDLELEMIWPPARDPGAGPTGGPAPGSGEPNARSMVAILHWRDFRMLLPGDAESELVPYDPGPVDVLKVAHHGSDDAGLDGLLEEADPALAVISVGESNTYGHPTDATLGSLSEAGVPVLRTDRDGTVSIVLEGHGYRVETGE